MADVGVVEDVGEVVVEEEEEEDVGEVVEEEEEAVEKQKEDKLLIANIPESFFPFPHIGSSLPIETAEKTMHGNWFEMMLGEDYEIDTYALKYGGKRVVGSQGNVRTEPASDTRAFWKKGFELALSFFTKTPTIRQKKQMAIDEFGGSVLTVQNWWKLNNMLSNVKSVKLTEKASVTKNQIAQQFYDHKNFSIYETAVFLLGRAFYMKFLNSLFVQKTGCIEFQTPYTIIGSKMLKVQKTKDQDRDLGTIKMSTNHLTYLDSVHPKKRGAFLRAFNAIRDIQQPLYQNVIAFQPEDNQNVLSRFIWGQMDSKNVKTPFANDMKRIPYDIAPIYFKDLDSLMNCIISQFIFDAESYENDKNWGYDPKAALSEEDEKLLLEKNNQDGNGWNQEKEEKLKKAQQEVKKKKSIPDEFRNHIRSEVGRISNILFRYQIGNVDKAFGSYGDHYIYGATNPNKRFMNWFQNVDPTNMVYPVIFEPIEDERMFARIMKMFTRHKPYSADWGKGLIGNSFFIPYSKMKTNNTQYTSNDIFQWINHGSNDTWAISKGFAESSETYHTLVYDPKPTSRTWTEALSKWSKISGIALVGIGATYYVSGYLGFKAFQSVMLRSVTPTWLSPAHAELHATLGGTLHSNSHRIVEGTAKLVEGAVDLLTGGGYLDMFGGGYARRTLQWFGGGVVRNVGWVAGKAGLNLATGTSLGQSDQQIADLAIKAYTKEGGFSGLIISAMKAGNTMKMLKSGYGELFTFLLTIPSNFKIMFLSRIQVGMISSAAKYAASLGIGFIPAGKVLFAPVVILKEFVALCLSLIDVIGATPIRYATKLITMLKPIMNMLKIGTQVPGLGFLFQLLGIVPWALSSWVGLGAVVMGLTSVTTMAISAYNLATSLIGGNIQSSHQKMPHHYGACFIAQNSLENAWDIDGPAVQMDKPTTFKEPCPYSDKMGTWCAAFERMKNSPKYNRHLSGNFIGNNINSAKMIPPNMVKLNIDIEKIRKFYGDEGFDSKTFQPTGLSEEDIQDGQTTLIDMIRDRNVEEKDISLFLMKNKNLEELSSVSKYDSVPSDFTTILQWKSKSTRIPIYFFPLISPEDILFMDEDLETSLGPEGYKNLCRDCARKLYKKMYTPVPAGYTNNTALIFLYYYAARILGNILPKEEDENVPETSDPQISVENVADSLSVASRTKSPLDLFKNDVLTIWENATKNIKNQDSAINWEQFDVMNSAIAFYSSSNRLFYEHYQNMWKKFLEVFRNVKNKANNEKFSIKHMKEFLISQDFYNILLNQEDDHLENYFNAKSRIETTTITPVNFSQVLLFIQYAELKTMNQAEDVLKLMKKRLQDINAMKKARKNIERLLRMKREITKISESVEIVNYIKNAYPKKAESIIPTFTNREQIFEPKRFRFHELKNLEGQIKLNQNQIKGIETSISNWNQEKKDILGHQESVIDRVKKGIANYKDWHKKKARVFYTVCSDPFTYPSASPV